jgi:hypothetical protein
MMGSKNACPLRQSVSGTFVILQSIVLIRNEGWLTTILICISWVPSAIWATTRNCLPDGIRKTSTFFLRLHNNLSGPFAVSAALIVSAPFLIIRAQSSVRNHSAWPDIG